MANTVNDPVGEGTPSDVVAWIEHGPPWVDDDGFCPHGLAAGVGCSTCEGWTFLTCHLCHKVKDASTPGRAICLLAFHYDRRHRGWTQPGVI